MASGRRLARSGRTGWPSAAMTVPVSAPRSIQNCVEDAALISRSRTRPPSSVRTTSGSANVRSLARNASKSMSLRSIAMPDPMFMAAMLPEPMFMPLPMPLFGIAHQGMQEQSLMTAPLIVHSAEDMRADRQEVVLMLHDFSFRAPDELLAGLC